MPSSTRALVTGTQKGYQRIAYRCEQGEAKLESVLERRSHCLQRKTKLRFNFVGVGKTEKVGGEGTKLCSLKKGG